MAIPSMLTVSLLRTLFFYFFLLLVLRIMGKRELGSLGPLDLVVTIILAEAAAIPIENPDRPFFLGIVPILTILALEMGLSYLCLKNETLRHILFGRPSVVIRKGKLVREEMGRLRYSVLDLLEQLRVRGYHNLADVEMAILESDGELSVLPTESSRPVSAADLHVSTAGHGPVYTVIIDGKIDKEALQDAGITEQQLQAQLAKQGIKQPADAFVAMITPSGLWVQKR